MSTAARTLHVSCVGLLAACRSAATPIPTPTPALPVAGQAPLPLLGSNLHPQPDSREIDPRSLQPARSARMIEHVC